MPRGHAGAAHVCRCATPRLREAMTRHAGQTRIYMHAPRSHAPLPMWHSQSSVVSRRSVPGLLVRSDSIPSTRSRWRQHAHDYRTAAVTACCNTSVAPSARRVLIGRARGAACARAAHKCGCQPLGSTSASAESNRNAGTPRVKASAPLSSMQFAQTSIWSPCSIISHSTLPNWRQAYSLASSGVFPYCRAGFELAAVGCFQSFRVGSESGRFAASTSEWCGGIRKLVHIPPHKRMAHVHLLIPA